jgi:hypothetical protein
MGYYHCTNCDDTFEYPYRKNPKYCKQCKSPHHLNKIERCQYYEWILMRNYQKTYSWLQTQHMKDFYKDPNRVWEYCGIIWDNYDTRHNS